MPWCRALLLQHPLAQLVAATVLARPAAAVAVNLAAGAVTTSDADLNLARTGYGIHDAALLNLLNSPTAVALNVTVEDAGSYTPQLLGGVQSVVFSSWAVIAILYDDVLEQKEFMQLARSLRFALADSLEVCRTSVLVTDMHAVKVDFVVDPMPLPKVRTQQHESHAASLLHRLKNLLRVDGERKDHPLQHINMTQVKATYEVRIFPEMRLKEPEVARRIDRLQIYHKFSDLNRIMARAVASENPALADSVMLDDIGYASRHVVDRPQLSRPQLDSCIEESLLQDARMVHQYIMGFCLALIILITCAGSVVFTVKTPSIIPSRMNPLIGARPG